MSERDIFATSIFATSSESELVAFYGSLFAIAAADGSVPDILVGMGFTDDLGVLLATIATVSVYINADAK